MLSLLMTVPLTSSTLLHSPFPLANSPSLGLSSAIISLRNTYLTLSSLHIGLKIFFRHHLGTLWLPLSLDLLIDRLFIRSLHLDTTHSYMHRIFFLTQKLLKFKDSNLFNHYSILSAYNLPGTKYMINKYLMKKWLKKEKKAKLLICVYA